MHDDDDHLPSLIASTDRRHTPSVVSAPVIAASSASPVQITLDLEGRELTLTILAADRPLVRHRLKELVRREKRRAASAGNAANTAQQIGVGIGGALAVGGGVALTTTASALMLGAALVTGVGCIIAVGGLIAGHWMSTKKFSHEEKMDRFQDALEELK